MDRDSLILLAALVAAAWLLPSCKETPKEQYERRLRETEGPMQHAVHSDRLLEIMAQLRHLTYSRLPQELEDAPMTGSRIAEIRWIAAGMSSAAKFIPDILEEVELAPEHEQEFRRMANELHRQCRTFEEMTTALTADRYRSTDGLVAGFSAVLDTCDGCHSRFRLLPRIRKD